MPLAWPASHPGFLPKAFPQCCRREAPSTHPKCKHIRKDRGSLPPEESAVNGDWSQRVRPCPPTLPSCSRGTVSGVFCTEVPIQPSSCGCHHASMTHTYIRSSFFSVSLYPPTSSHLLLLGITSQINFLPLNPHFRLCLQGKPN